MIDLPSRSIDQRVVEGLALSRRSFLRRKEQLRISTFQRPLYQPSACKSFGEIFAFQTDVKRDIRKNERRATVSSLTRNSACTRRLASRIPRNEARAAETHGSFSVPFSRVFRQRGETIRDDLRFKAAAGTDNENETGKHRCAGTWIEANPLWSGAALLCIVTRRDWQWHNARDAEPSSIIHRYYRWIIIL